MGINVTDLRSQSGYELLTIMGKGAKPALIPLPVPVLRAVRDATADRAAGPLLLNQHGDRLTRRSAAGQLSRLARDAGLSQQLSPHTLRRTFCTAGLVSGVPLRDMQYGMRHADSRTPALRHGPREPRPARSPRRRRLPRRDERRLRLLHAVRDNRPSERSRPVRGPWKAARGC